jgi:hypothetical protein
VVENGRAITHNYMEVTAIQIIFLVGFDALQAVFRVGHLEVGRSEEQVGNRVPGQGF